MRKLYFEEWIDVDFISPHSAIRCWIIKHPSKDEFVVKLCCRYDCSQDLWDEDFYGPFESLQLAREFFVVENKNGDYA